MRMIALISVLVAWFSPVFTQTINAVELSTLYEKAMDRHPLGRRAGMLEEATALQLEQIDAARLPEINLLANARLQSENVQVPFQIPGEEAFELPLFIAQTYLDAQYAIYEGGAARAHREKARLGLLAEQQGVVVELAGLKERINQPFFTILQLRARRQVLQANLADLRARVQQLEAGQRYGTVLPGDVDQVRIEVLRLEAALQQTQGQIAAAFATLSDLTGEPIDTSTVLRAPDLAGFALSDELERPELRHFELRQDYIEAGEAMIAAERRPKLSAFAQGGFGYPNPLNFFDDKVSPYAMVGLRFQWKLFDWNKTDLDRQLLSVESRLVENQQAVFEHKLNVQEAHFQEEIASLEELIRRDRAILELQAGILEKAAAQLDQGIITPAEYIDQVNDGIRASLDLETHRLQLEQLKVHYLTLKGLL